MCVGLLTTAKLGVPQHAVNGTEAESGNDNVRPVVINDVSSRCPDECTDQRRADHLPTRFWQTEEPVAAGRPDLVVCLISHVPSMGGNREALVT